MSPGERLFFGIPLSPAVREAIENALNAAGSAAIPGRVVPARNWHITLRFLGDAAPDQKPILVNFFEAAVLPRTFRLSLQGWGAFPRPARARVLWIGTDHPRAQLTELAALAEAAARAAGFPAEDRPFKSHVTLTRLDVPRDLRPLLHSLPQVEAALDVDRFVLFRSDLGSGPARYEPVRTWSLPD